MAVNPFTLNSLYNQGIIDYTPYDLCNGGMYPGMYGAGMNPYMQSAMQGNLYQNYGTGQDGFFYGSNCCANNRGFGNTLDKIPNFLKGLVAGTLIIGTAALCLRGKKKPPVKPEQNESFFSKLKFWKKKS